MNFKSRLAKLIEVKTIITLTMLGVFAYLSVTRAIETKDFLELFKIVIVFFFGVQVEKHNNNKGGQS